MQVFKSPLLLTMLSLSLAFGPPSWAAGWIMVDPGLGPLPHPPLVTPVTPPNRTIIHPVGPINTVPPVTPVRPPVLHGSVSFGLHLQNEEVKTSIKDQVAKTYIKQVFANDTDRNLAGTYLFPLPADTTFSSFSLHIDGKPVEGQILEAEAARQEYEAIVRRMVDPGLLEYADYKTVRARIFPIPAHGTKTVELEYTQLLKAENGMLKYNFPLRTEGETNAAEEIKVAVDVSSKQALKAVWSPTHQVTLDRNGDHQAKISFFEKNSLPDKDFLLCYSVSDKDLAANLLTHKVPSEDGYFLMTLSPPLKASNAINKDVVFVVDTSGSMQGEKIEETKRAIKYVLHAMGQGDRFGLIQFNTDVDYFKLHLLAATPENKKSAESYVDGLEARGGTDISDALNMGCSMLNEVSDRPAYLILMTDGEPTVGETSEAKILKSVAPKREVRIFDFGVGYDINTRLLNKLAEQHHGTSQYIEPNENVEIAVSNFYEKIKSPFLSDVKIDYEGIETKDVYPRDVKDIFAGTQLMLLGKYKGGGKCTVHLTGKINGVQKAYSFPLSFQSEEADNTYLPRLWAMRRIGHLTDVAHDNGDSREVIDEIVALSKKYGIITEFTSFLVTDPSENVRLGHLPGRPVMRPLVARRSLAGGGMVAAAPAPPMMEMASLPQASFRTAKSPAAHEHYAHYRASAAQDLADADGFAANARMSEEKSIAGLPAVSHGKFIGQPGDNLYASVSGKKAVLRAKSVMALKDSEYLADEKQSAASGVKTVADKTFYLQNGIWVDSAVNPDTTKKAKEIVFASKEYFDLIHSAPSIAKYLSVGQEVILQFKGQIYKILAAAKASG
jgi:Ca-activated chloride channel family protein